MPTSIITTDDLREFKMELLEEFEQLLSKHVKIETHKTWLRAADVKNRLQISHSTLQKLRHKNILTAHKLEGILFYDAAEIDRLLTENSLS